MQIDLAEIATAWAPLARIVFVPHTDGEYSQLAAVLDQLIEEVGETALAAGLLRRAPRWTT